MEVSLTFYTQILGFKLKYANSTMSPTMNLIREGAEIQLSILGGDGAFGNAVNILMDDVDELFKEFIERGLDTSTKMNSPVHQSPINQSWGMREFYVDDPNGNTLRFSRPIHQVETENS